MAVVTLGAAACNGAMAISVPWLERLSFYPEPSIILHAPCTHWHRWPAMTSPTYLLTMGQPELTDWLTIIQSFILAGCRKWFADTIHKALGMCTWRGEGQSCLKVFIIWIISKTLIKNKNENEVQNELLKKLKATVQGVRSLESFL